MADVVAAAAFPVIIDHVDFEGSSNSDIRFETCVILHYFGIA